MTRVSHIQARKSWIEEPVNKVLVIRYEGPRGRPGMQEILYPTSYLESRGLGKHCAVRDIEKIR